MALIGFLRAKYGRWIFELWAIFTTIGIGSVELLRLEGLLRGSEAVARALDHTSSWVERRPPELTGRR